MLVSTGRTNTATRTKSRSSPIPTSGANAAISHTNLGPEGRTASDDGHRRSLNGIVIEGPLIEFHSTTEGSPSWSITHSRPDVMETRYGLIAAHPWLGLSSISCDARYDLMLETNTSPAAALEASRCCATTTGNTAASPSNPSASTVTAMSTSINEKPRRYIRCIGSIMVPPPLGPPRPDPRASHRRG